jgi:hypothetical protein
MAAPATATSPQTFARVGGALYLLIIFAGALGELFIRGKLVVPGDAAPPPAASSPRNRYGVWALPAIWSCTCAMSL